MSERERKMSRSSGGALHFELERVKYCFLPSKWYICNRYISCRV